MYLLQEVLNTDECEITNKTEFFPNWLKYAVPLKDGEPESCRRYPYNSTIKQNCGIDDFQTENPIPCDKLIFETNEKTLATEFNITCEQNFWLLTLPGTVNGIGELVCLPLSGFVSDRCFIEACENGTTVFTPEWLNFTVPFEDGNPKNCEKYTFTPTPSQPLCSPENFNSQNVTHCEVLIYKSEEKTIATDFNITCEENFWWLTLPGTINGIGELICLPLSGFISDKYGRRTMMLTSIFIATIAGIARGLAPTYTTFVIFEFLDKALASGFFYGAFIIGVELVVPEKRVLANTLLGIAYALGEMTLGIVASFVSHWRMLILSLTSSGFLVLWLAWSVPESIRWLLSKGKSKQAKNILVRIAKENGSHLKDDLLKKISSIEYQEETKEESVLNVFKSSSLMLRVLLCCCVWICCTFTYYGLTLHAVFISGNIYINYIAVAAIEIPAYYIFHITSDKFGRKPTIITSLFISGISCLAFIFIKEYYILKLMCFLMGKFAMTIAYTVLYMYCTEMFPTCLRHSLLSVCSMFGRIGSITAPQVPLLATVSEYLPMMLFGIFGLIAGVLSFKFPETHNRKLPDTIEEAIELI